MSDADLIARLDLAVAKNRKAGEELAAAVKDQKETTRRMRIAVNDLRGQQYMEGKK